MSDMVNRREYTTEIPFTTDPELHGRIIIESDNKKFNDFIEDHLVKLLKDIYYGCCEEFEL